MFERSDIEATPYQTADMRTTLTQLHRLAEDTHWYNGTVASVARRRRAIAEADRNARTLLAGRVPDGEAASLQDGIEFCKESSAHLSGVEDILQQDEHQEKIGLLPQYRVAAATAVRTPIRRTANIAKVAKDWDHFAKMEPFFFVSGNRDAIPHPAEMRERAYDFILAKSSGLDNELLRGTVVSEFINGVEKERRVAVATIRRAGKVRTSTVAGQSVRDLPDTALFL